MRLPHRTSKRGKPFAVWIMTLVQRGSLTPRHLVGLLTTRNFYRNNRVWLIQFLQSNYEFFMLMNINVVFETHHWSWHCKNSGKFSHNDTKYVSISISPRHEKANIKLDIHQPRQPRQPRDSVEGLSRVSDTRLKLIKALSKRNNASTTKYSNGHHNQS